MKDLMRVIEQETYEYSDAVTQFLECLFTHYDFEGAQQKLRECEEVRASDAVCKAGYQFHPVLAAIGGAHTLHGARRY